jgi:hypothetical protein
MNEFGPDVSQSSAPGQELLLPEVPEKDPDTKVVFKEITEGMTLDEIIEMDPPTITRCND